MTKNILILLAGIGIGYLIFKKRVLNPQSLALVKPGDKSKDIEGMQMAFEKIAGLQFENYGQYDADTLATVQYLLNGTSGLKDSMKGYVDPVLVKDLSKIYNNSKTQ
jgi:hypothetical protein